jgi:hypothetical protein
MSCKPIALATALAAALALGLAPGVAVSAGGAQVAQQQPTSFADDQLRQYAMAVIEVREINQTYVPKMRAAETDRERANLQSQATEEMVQAVRGAGLDVDTYNAIYDAVQSDPTVAKKVDGYVQQAQ